MPVITIKDQFEVMYMNEAHSFGDVFTIQVNPEEKFDSEIKRLKTLNSEHIIKIQDYFIED